jgi:serine-type D-Ala-D-Ala carboxypeptidase/endopeptidase (penicillin-binding protein 4)
MLILMVQKTFRRTVALIMFSGLMISASYAQVYSRPVSPNPSPTPFLQTIIVGGQNNPRPSSTPFNGNGVKIIDEVTPTSPIPSSIPGYSGVLVETMDGKVIRDNYSNYAFNPASNVKILTTYAVIKTLGPNYRFPTNVSTDGEIDKNTGTLTGNLYISGKDPSFNHENAVEIAEALNKFGIRNIQGDLVVTEKFVMNFTESTERSAQMLFASLDANKRSAVATRAWQTFLTSSGKFNQLSSVPSVSFSGGLYVELMPNNLKMLFSHESAPLREIVKVMMSYSNNFMAERLGDSVGGYYAVAGICQRDGGFAPNEMILQSSSGLGVNRVTPRAMMKTLRMLLKLLESNRMTFGDIMPIAGRDQGTLERRFNTGNSTGSVVGKTGTLGNTDGGVSALSGIMNTQKGKLFFVIFNQRGGVNGFRTFQNKFVSGIQDEFGGPVTLGFPVTQFAVRLANTRITYPQSRPRS